MKTRSIKSVLPKFVSIMLLLFLLLILPVNLYIQLYIQHKGQREGTAEMFGQFEQLLRVNEEELKNEERQFKESCIRAADMVAYHVKYSKETVLGLNRSRELAGKMDVDEIHFFTTDGKIYAGTHPEYYGFTFDSGEQMRFFKPMLYNRSLKLCQDITPNTAEQKEMQYAAVWLDDESGIVQIGMQPHRLQQRIEEKSLNNVIKGMPFEVNGDFHILDKETYKIIASTESNLKGKKIFEKKQITHSDKVSDAVHIRWNGTRYCLYSKDYQDYILIRMYHSLSPVANMLQSSSIVIIYVLFGTIGILVILRWYIQQKLGNNLAKITYELQKIEKGRLEDIGIKTDITEFEELIFYINQMLNSVRLSQQRLSNILNISEIPFGFYERNSFYHQSFVNQRLIEILGEKEYGTISSERRVSLIEKKMEEIEKDIISESEKVYRYYRYNTEVYLRIEKIIDNQSIVYCVTDITPLWEGANQLKRQSQMDELTALYNRRGFYERMDGLFKTPDVLRHAAMLMIDADGLKIINDNYGHFMGDCYLKAIAELLQMSAQENSISARFGGDEFAVFLYGYSSTEDLENVIVRIKKGRGNAFTQEKNCGQTLQFSVGTAFYSKDGTDFHVLMRIADERMYQDKKLRKKKKYKEIIR